MYKVGLIGAADLMKAHLTHWAQIPEVQVVGCFSEQGFKSEDAFSMEYFSSIDALIASVDIVDLVSVEEDQIDIAKIVLLRSRHLFLTNPTLISVKGLQELASLSREARVHCQVGFLWRYHEGFSSFYNRKTPFVYFDIHRTLVGNCLPGADLLLAQDLDLLLQGLHGRIKRINALALEREATTRFYNLRLEYENGSVANLVSTLGHDDAHRLSYFQEGQSMSQIYTHQKEAPLLEAAFSDFIQSISKDRVTKVGIFDAMHIKEILDQVHRQLASRSLATDLEILH